MWPKTIQVIKRLVCKFILRCIGVWVLLFFPIMFIVSEFIRPSYSFKIAVKEEWLNWRRAFWDRCD